MDFVLSWGPWGGRGRGVAPFSKFLNIFKLSSKFSLLLLNVGGSWGERFLDIGDFCRGGVDFLLGGLVDFLKPKCLRSNVSFLIFKKICRPKCGWGFFLGFLGGFLVFLGLGGRGAILRGIFKGEGFSCSWQIFLLGVGHFKNSFG